uniref:Uncharacterized protein n=1 Tax=Chenopodium quinoa TaxID=63459 RepID=A0A803LG98_CHEQI
MEMEMEKLGCLTHLFVTLFLASFAGVVSMPALTDVTMEALCPGKDECSLAIYLSGFQQAADKISEGKRASAFGILAGVSSAAFVCGTLSARFLSTAQTFQAAAFSAMAAAAYMRIFLQEITRKTDASIQPLLKSDPSSSSDDDMTKKVQIFKKIPTFHNIKSLLGSSKTFSQITVMVLFNSLAEGGLQASLMYFLKAEFHFSKNQFADLMLIVGIAGMVSQHITETAKRVQMRSIASKQVGESEQGKAQGCISGIGSLANIISPLVFSPLTGNGFPSKSNDKGNSEDFKQHGSLGNR